PPFDVPKVAQTFMESPSRISDRQDADPTQLRRRLPRGRGRDDEQAECERQHCQFGTRESLHDQSPIFNRQLPTGLKLIAAHRTRANSCMRKRYAPTSAAATRAYAFSLPFQRAKQVTAELQGQVP